MWEASVIIWDRWTNQLFRWEHVGWKTKTRAAEKGLIPEMRHGGSNPTGHFRHWDSANKPCPTHCDYNSCLREMGSVWRLHYFDFCQLKSDAIRWSPCSAYLTLQDAEETGPDPTKHLSDSISLNGTTCMLKIKHALKCFVGLMPVCTMGGKIRFVVITRVLFWFLHAGGLDGFIFLPL